VSQHLAVLRDSGLVNGHRVGRVVLYARSPTGDYLAAGISDAPSPSGHAAGAPGSSAS
jgi:DNA-binding transcriptional ArsR family regulator